MFYIGALDTTQEDRFIKNFPACLEDSPSGRSRWFSLLMAHGAQHDIYIHDLYCFRTLTLSTQQKQSEFRGFTCGSESDTEQYDLPEQLSIPLTRWSGKIYLGLIKSGIFPAGGKASTYIASNSLKDGYALLLKTIRNDIPTYREYPATLLGNRPKQKAGETIQQYFDRTMSWLKLRSIVENNGDN